MITHDCPNTQGSIHFDHPVCIQMVSVSVNTAPNPGEIAALVLWQIDTHHIESINIIDTHYTYFTHLGST